MDNSLFPSIVFFPCCIDVLFACSPPNDTSDTSSILTGVMRSVGTDGTEWIPHLHSIPLDLSPGRSSPWSLIPCSRVFHTSPGAPPPTLRFNDVSVAGKPCFGRPMQEIGFQVTGFESVSQIQLKGNKEEWFVEWDKDGEGHFSTGLGSFCRVIPSDARMVNVGDYTVIAVARSSETHLKSIIFDYEKEIGSLLLQ